MTRKFFPASWVLYAVLLAACGGGGGSSSTPMVNVPDLVGDTQAAATSALTGVGLTLGTVTTQNSASVAAGAVISEMPAAGASVASGSSVALVVSSGPVMVNVPNVVGTTQSVATTAITNAGLTVGTVTMSSSATVAAGEVISENPASGTSVASGSAVALIISSGSGPVTVPNVVGQAQSTATGTLTGLGLSVTATMQASTTVASGKVISETPTAGTSVSGGTNVALVVSSGAGAAVPSVVGDTQAAATSAITGAGFAVGIVSTQSSNSIAAGIVISQNPAAGANAGTGSKVNLVVSNGTTAANTLSVVVDQGPAALAQANQGSANTLYASVTICTPGTTICQTIDHVQVDTGSIGLQILSEVINGPTPAPIIDPATQAPLRECVQFADGYSWGSMATADVTFGDAATGARSIANLPIHIIGDKAAGSAPASCSKSLSSENTVLEFGANGIIGIGYFVQDCGMTCVTNALSPLYYACPSQGTCQPTTVALSNQLTNPIAALSSDNTGAYIVLPAVSPPGAANLNGKIYFGVDTQSNNALGSATVYTVDDFGDFDTNYNSKDFGSSFIDSGSNAYFFADSTIVACKTDIGWFCPNPTLNLSATITGKNNASLVVNFTVGNAELLFSDSSLTVFPTLAGSNGGFTGLDASFDWGLPFLFGRPYFVLFENYVGAAAKPSSAF